MRLAARPFADDDLAAIQAAIAGWIREAGPLGYCHAAEIAHRIYENPDPNRLPVGDMVEIWEAVDSAAIVGVAINARFGRAFDVFTSPALRGTDAELAMLAHAHTTTARVIDDRDDPDRAVLTDVFAGDQARMRLLAELGFEHYRLWDHIVERALAAPIPEAPVPAGFTIRVATVADAAALAFAKNDAFGHAWTPEAYRAWAMGKPGCAPEREVVVVAPDGRIAAFADLWLDPLNRVGHFEPVGTPSEFRRRGLARAAMLGGLRRMRAAGMATATVEYDAENFGAAALYRGLGFTPKFEIVGYRASAPGTPA